jgi:5-formyltetrahydrofolate cyclo-ligase
MSRRAELREARRAVPDGERNRAAGRVADLVRDSEFIAAGDVVGLYLADDGELDTTALVDVVATTGAQVALPVVQAASAMTFRTWDPGSGLTVGRYGIPVPVAGQIIPPFALDVAIVPCVAFDRFGHRLGRGAGYYDRAFAARRREGPPPLLVGIGFDCQLVDGLTPADYDVDLDVVVTPTTLLWASAMRFDAETDA